MDLSRTEALLGADALRRLASLRVAVIGVGGVGSWCAEALVRTGVGHLWLVDDDIVAPSNVNRQCPATSRAIGAAKVLAMKERLLAINPECDADARQVRVEGLPDFCASADVVVDAIDSVSCKAQLILDATRAGIPLVSSMGAAFRRDPTKVVVRRFDKVEGDALARALRQRFKRLGFFPARPFNAVVSLEPPAPHDPSAEKGSYMPVTCAFGMALAAEVLNA